MEQIITENPYLCSPNILWHPDAQTKAVALDFAGTGGCIKAGSPISAAGKVANDASAVGVLLHDAHELCCSHGLVVIGGYIKSDIAQTHSGIEISDAARSAMSRLAFIGADSIYKVSDMVLSDDDLIGASITTGAYGGVIDNSWIIFSSDDIAYLSEMAVVAVRKDNATVDGIPFPEKGTYFFKGKTFTSALKKQSAIPMDESFMPVLTSPNGTKYKITVDDTGALSTTAV